MERWEERSDDCILDAGSKTHLNAGLRHKTEVSENGHSGSPFTVSLFLP